MCNDTTKPYKPTECKKIITLTQRLFIIEEQQKHIAKLVSKHKK